MSKNGCKSVVIDQIPLGPTARCSGDRFRLIGGRAGEVIGRIVTDRTFPKMSSPPV